MPFGQDNAYGRKYAQLYADLGFRSLHPANSGSSVVKNLEAVGVPISKSWMVTSYRNPPTKDNIERAAVEVKRIGMGDNLRFFDYGDEIAFSEWFSMLIDDEIALAKSAGKKPCPPRWSRAVGSSG